MTPACVHPHPNKTRKNAIKYFNVPSTKCCNAPSIFTSVLTAQPKSEPIATVIPNLEQGCANLWWHGSACAKTPQSNTSLPYTERTMKLTNTAVALCLTFPFVLASPAQTKSQTSSAVRHTSSTAHRTPTAATGNPADHPPGVPPVRGIPKPLYALRYVDILVGGGDVAATQKYYTVRYTGWTTDGKKFDSSDDHPGKDPITFPYGGHRVIMGWDTGFEECASAASVASSSRISSPTESPGKGRFRPRRT